MLKVKMPLSPSEKLLIWRRRGKITQRQAAKIYKMPEKKYRNWEKGLYDWDPNIDVIMPLDDQEKCFLLRKRFGYEQGDIAKRIGATRTMITEAENYNVPIAPLKEFWVGEILAHST